jgi:hypothetical protein
MDDDPASPLRNGQLLATRPGHSIDFVSATPPSRTGRMLHFLIVLALILFNAFFAMSEMAVMTSRKSRLKQMAQGSRRAAKALELSEQPRELPLRGAAVDHPAQPADGLFRRRVHGR